MPRSNFNWFVFSRKKSLNLKFDTKSGWSFRWSLKNSSLVTAFLAFEATLFKTNCLLVKLLVLLVLFQSSYCLLVLSCLVFLFKNDLVCVYFPHNLKTAEWIFFISSAQGYSLTGVNIGVSDYWTVSYTITNGIFQIAHKTFP